VGARKHTLFILSQIEYFLKKLDTIGAENGKSFLDANPVLVSTELGNGGGGHNVKNVFHALSSANGRFKTGNVHMFDSHASNFYSAILAGVGIDAMMGESKSQSERDKVLAVIKA
jgi:hypothetical protein